VGGAWRFIMHGPDVTDYPNKIVYREIVKPERLVYDHGDDNDAHSHRFRATVTFAAQGRKTKVTMPHCSPAPRRARCRENSTRSRAACRR
jgi:uncharacterized protein YndB with AHSA1/START domain